MTINERQDEIIEEFQDFDDWMDKYQLLIDLGNGQEPLDEKYKVESNLIDGCQSRVWLQADLIEGRSEKCDSFPGRERCPDCEGYRGTTDTCAQRFDSSGNTGCRSLFHRTDRTERTPVTYSQQWSAGNGETDAHVCISV